jgi:hypothetical protein
MLAYQLFSFLLYVCLYAKLLHMPAANSTINISLYICSLRQSSILAWYMPVLYANNSMSNFYDLEDVSYLRLSIYYCIKLLCQVICLCICQFVYLLQSYNQYASQYVSQYVEYSISAYMPNAVSITLHRDHYCYLL